MKVLHWPFLGLRKGFFVIAKVQCGDICLATAACLIRRQAACDSSPHLIRLLYAANSDAARQKSPPCTFSVIILVFIYLSIFCFSTKLVFAADPVDLGEVVVEGAQDKREKPSLDRSAAATVLIPEESKQEAQTLSELLEESAGVNVRRYGGLDDFSALSLRGSSAGQVQIYLDDIPLTTSQGAITDLGLVPLAALERAEVYRGGSPGKLPESTIGGVVILKSKKKPEKRDADVFGTVGSFETIKGRANYSASLGKISPVLAFEHAQSKGDFLYKNDNGTRSNTADDKVERRQNNDFASNSLFTKFIFDLPKEINLSFTDIFFQKDEGIPGLGSRESSNARLGTLREIASLAADKDYLHADVFFDYLDSQFDDPKGEVSLTPQDNDDKTYRFGENLRAGFDIGSHQHITAFIANRSEFYLPYNRLGKPQHGPKDSRYSIDAGLEEEIILFRDRLSIIPSLRVENLFNRGNFSSRNDNQLSAKLGLSLRVVDELYFKGNAYRGFRNPTFSELFGNRGTLQGNPNLRAEKAINFDAGLSYDFPTATWFDGGHIEATYYHSNADNLIQFVQTSQFTAKAMNMNNAIIQGVEAAASAKFAKRLRFTASYTFQSAKDDSGNPDTRGKYLPGRPKHELYALAGWHETWLPWFASSVFCDLNYMSGNYLDKQNLLQVQNRTILGTGVDFVFVDRFTASFSVKNILNDMIADIIGYPLPGRSYWGSLNVSL